VTSAETSCRFLPTSRKEMDQRSWDELDVLFISGDAYIDHPAFGTPLLARLLEAKGYRVGILAQPDWRDPETFKGMGRPRLFAAISAGAMDSMVNHYTAAKKIRRDDAYTPGGHAGARPNRAVIAYTAAVKGAFKQLPTVIGGIEASLRRLAHYDYWSDSVRRSILIDSKADLLLYGMAETAIVELTRRLAAGELINTITDLPGTAFATTVPTTDGILLPSFDALHLDTQAYNEAFRLASQQTNPQTAQTLIQPHGTRFVQVNRPASPLSEEELDRIYALPFCRLPHPAYSEKIPAFEQIRFSITSHRGCFGGCAFCAITHHQGKTIQSRSPASIEQEVDQLTRHPDFKGTISDVGGPTANMYRLGCRDPQAELQCRRSSCLFPEVCRNLRTSDPAATKLLADLRQHPKVKHLFIASGIRYDLLPFQPDYFNDLLQYHVGGLIKVAPESGSSSVAKVMQKPGPDKFSSFLAEYRDRSQNLGLRQGVVPYFISAHPGCTVSDMIDTALFLKRNRLQVEQVQEFTPTPGSLSTCIYHTGLDPFSGETVHIPRSMVEKRQQKALLLYHLPEQRNEVIAAFKQCGRESELGDLYPESTYKISGKKSAQLPQKGVVQNNRSRHKSKRKH